MSQLWKRAASAVAALIVIVACALLVSQRDSHVGVVGLEQLSRSESMSLRKLAKNNERLAGEIESLKTDVEDEEKDNERLRNEVSDLTSKVSSLVPLRGPPGPKGQTGDTGAPGTPGVPGLMGPPGPMGNPGPAGSPGVPGPTGQTGQTGPRGHQGTPGFRGEKGRRGLPGVAGRPGADGERGPRGKAGTPGEDGVNGLQGIPGQIGPPGKDGKDGLPGKDGANGKNGVDGIDGQPGTPGAVGEAGDPGPRGPPGVPGKRGPRGDAGVPGHRGPSGAPGAQGLQGPTGPAGPPGSPAPDAHVEGSHTGLLARWYTMKLQKLPANFLHAKPVRSTTVPLLNFVSNDHNSEIPPFSNSGLTFDFAAQFEGFLNIPEAGKWTFELESDDGSRLLIDDVEVVDNDGLHGMEKKSGLKVLAVGQHKLVVDFFQQRGGAGLILRWSGPGVPELVPIPASAFRCNPSER